MNTTIPPIQDVALTSVDQVPRLVITGKIGTLFRIEFTDSKHSTWTTRKSIVLPSSPFYYMDTEAVGQTFYRVSTNAKGPEVIALPAGQFTMGSPIDEAERTADELQHTVTLSKAFSVGKYPVTQAEYLEVTGTNPSVSQGVVSLSCPVENVSWHAAVAYCEALTKREQAAGRLPAGMVYRLPTEAEREYACRVGSKTRYYYGEDIGCTVLPNYCWWGQNSNNSVQPVGQKLPNAWGLHDMHGNVWEWCLDWFGSYDSIPATNPVGVPTGAEKVIRGGSWRGMSRFCRSAQRASSQPGLSSNNNGFRIVLAQPIA